MSPNNRIIVVFIVLLLLSGSIGIGRVPPTAAANGARMRLWKLAREFGLKIMVCHLPPGTSKWNRIELRRFSFISQNWRGRPPRSPLIIVSLIGATTTEASLKVYCDVDENVYSRRIKVGDAEMKALDVRRAAFHGEWKYSLLPTPNTDAVVS